MATFSSVFPITPLAEQVNVKSLVKDGFGRIVFSWGQPVSHEMAYRNRILKIRFGRPFHGSMRQLAKRMGKYVKQVRKGTDGRSITLYLTDEFEVVGFDLGNAVIFEIYDPPQSEIKTKQGESLGRIKNKTPNFRATSANTKNNKKIGVRTGRHSGYFVLSWIGQKR